MINGLQDEIIETKLGDVAALEEESLTHKERVQKAQTAVERAAKALANLPPPVVCPSCG